MKLLRIARHVAAVSVALTLGACQTLQNSTRNCTTGVAMIETQLFFGLSKRSGEVTPAEWRDFLNREVVPHFAEGFTVVEAQGFWLNSELKRTISEKSKVLVRVHPEGAAHDKAIGEIIDAYKARFAQESVLRVDRPACVMF
jgi:Protein of unknown function (DUF3574)